MILRFSKMHGIGNDFIVIDCITQNFRAIPEQMKLLGDRHFGIGCDQILLVEPPERPENDFRYRIFNADGGEVEQCGNGARCFARYVRDKGLIGKNTINVETSGGDIVLYLEKNGVRVDMGEPRFTPSEIPFTAHNNETAKLYPLPVDGNVHEIGVVSMGNPHSVCRVDDVDAFDVENIGPAIESHEQFPERVNAGFMQVLDADNIKLRVFERGAGETLACGTGACAAVVHGIQMGWLNSRVNVVLPGGELTIEWQGGNNGVQLIGPAEFVFEGKIKL